ncbi:hypothetical protein JTB14_020811 [Gonioctena quinquepunctata]|nr:hypothetical protein JTB14_020811 [Gonioctena quinquepunctata]
MPRNAVSSARIVDYMGPGTLPYPLAAHRKAEADASVSLKYPYHKDAEEDKHTKPNEDYPRPMFNYLLLIASFRSLMYRYIRGGI